MKKNLSFDNVTPALPKAASTRRIHVWMFVLSNVGSSTFLMLLLDAAWEAASMLTVLVDAANSRAAACAEAVAILTMSSTLRLAMLSEYERASLNCSPSTSSDDLFGDGGRGGKWNVPGAEGLADLDRIRSARPRPC